MPILWRASLGYLSRHPWQFITALSGIGIGVAVMLAVELANESSRRAFLLSMEAVNGEATHQIVAGPSGLDQGLYVRLRVEEGLRNVAPVVQGYADVQSTTLHLLGVDPFAERRFRNYIYTGPDGEEQTANSPLLAGMSVLEILRRLLAEPGSVLLSEETAAALGLSVGERFDLRIEGRRKEARLAGLIAADRLRGVDNLLIADISTAQQWLGMSGKLSRIDVRLLEADAYSVDYFSRKLPAGTWIISAEGRSESVAAMSEAFMTNLTAMSLLALLIGVFLIFNSVSFAVLQRRRLLGVLRALGVTQWQVTSLILGEALVLGILGSILGVGLGIWFGEKLLVLVSRSMNDLYFVVNVREVVLPTSALLKSFLAGIGVTLVAAAVPALEAASYPPRLTLARSTIEQKSGMIVPILALAGLGAAAAALLLLRLSGSSLVSGLVAVFMLIMGLAVGIPFVVRVVSIAASRPARRISTSLRLAVAGIGASLSRTGVAIVALAVAVSATIGVSIMVDSFRASVGTWVENSLRSDVFVSVAHGTLDPRLVQDISRLGGVADHSNSRRVWLESDLGRVRLTAIDFSREGFASVQLEQSDVDAVRHAFEEENAVLASNSFAYRRKLEAGDTVSLPTPAGLQAFRVAGTYRSFDADLDALLVSRTTYRSVWKDPNIDSLGLFLRDGVSAATLVEQIRDLSAGRQALIVSSNRELRERSMRIFDRTFVITNVLYWLAVAVAFVGILGAMLALQLERARELAVFRCVGMTAGQVGRMVLLQTGLVGLWSGAAAVPLGLVMAWMLINVINRRAFGWDMTMVVSPLVLLTALLLALVASVLAGIYPAWRAARANPAMAMREE